MVLGIAAVTAPANAAPPTYIVKDSTTLPGGTAGAGVAVDSSRGLVYVAQRFANQVVVLDEATLDQVAIIPVPNQPYNIAVEPTSGSIYVSEYVGNAMQGYLAVIDPVTLSVVSTLPTGDSPVGVTYNPVNKRVYVANYSSNFLSVFDATSPLALTAQPNIPMPARTETITVHPSGSPLYVAGSDSNVWLVDPTTGLVTTTWTGYSPSLTRWHSRVTTRMHSSVNRMHSSVNKVLCPRRSSASQATVKSDRSRSTARTSSLKTAPTELPS